MHGRAIPEIDGILLFVMGMLPARAAGRFAATLALVGFFTFEKGSGTVRALAVWR